MTVQIDPVSGLPLDHPRHREIDSRQQEKGLREQAAFADLRDSEPMKKLVEAIEGDLLAAFNRFCAEDPEARALLSLLSRVSGKVMAGERAVRLLRERYFRTDAPGNEFPG